MHQSNGAARQEIIDKLSMTNASISPKYFYDILGCRLFELITRLPEYYLSAHTPAGCSSAST